MSKKPPCYEPYGVSGYAVALRLIRTELIDANILREMGNDLMRRIAEYCVRRGAKSIGHIKSFLRSEEGYLRADTIGLERGVQVESNITKPIRQAYVVVNSIVQGIDKSQVRGATLEAITEVIEKYGFRVEMEREHEYFDEFDIPPPDNRSKGWSNV